MYKAFKKYDSAKTGFVSAHDLRKVLNDFSYLLSDEQFTELLIRYMNFLGRTGSTVTEYMPYFY